VKQTPLLFFAFLFAESISLSMTFHDLHLNSMTFQVLHDLHEPCCVSLLPDYIWFTFYFTSLLAGPQLTATISEAIPFSLSLTACQRQKRNSLLPNTKLVVIRKVVLFKSPLQPFVSWIPGRGWALYKVLSERLRFKGQGQASLRYKCTPFR